MSGRADEASDRHRRNSVHDVYGYPDVVRGLVSSLQKAHDIYGLELILVEISGWQRIDEIFKVPKGGPQAAVNVFSNARGSLLDVAHLDEVDIFAHDE